MNSTNVLADKLPPSWGVDRIIAGCPKCKHSFLISKSEIDVYCPVCYQEKLSQIQSSFRYEPPERIIPIGIDEIKAVPLLEQFVNEVKLRCDDFTTQLLSKRLRLVYVPMWLVDATISGDWDANAGFPQQVKSSVEKFSDGSWKSQDVIETKLHWEKRVGHIFRRYENIATSAAMNMKDIAFLLNEYDLEQSVSYSPALLQSAQIAVPNIEPGNAWQFARPQFEKTAFNEVLTACGANELQDYHLSPEFFDFNWTQILLPVFSSYYQDDDGNYQVVAINAQTGAIHGKRVASQQKGFLYAGIAFAIALATFLFGLGAFALAPIIPPVSFLGLLFIPISIIATVIAGYFMILPWHWNSTHNQQED